MLLSFSISLLSCLLFLFLLSLVLFLLLVLLFFNIFYNIILRISCIFGFPIIFKKCLKKHIFKTLGETKKIDFLNFTENGENIKKQSFFNFSQSAKNGKKHHFPRKWLNFHFRPNPRKWCFLALSWFPLEFGQTTDTGPKGFPKTYTHGLTVRVFKRHPVIGSFEPGWPHPFRDICRSWSAKEGHLVVKCQGKTRPRGTTGHVDRTRVPWTILEWYR